LSHVIKHKEVDSRGAFFIEQDGKRVAVMTYSRATPTLVILDHTEVAKELGGQGIGRKLLDAAVAWARETNTRFKVTCPYASAQFAKDATIRDVLG
jgi:predicted GNAT family acetyltransferase